MLSVFGKHNKNDLSVILSISSGGGFAFSGGARKIHKRAWHFNCAPHEEPVPDSSSSHTIHKSQPATEVTTWLLVAVAGFEPATKGL